MECSRSRRALHGLLTMSVGRLRSCPNLLLPPRFSRLFLQARRPRRAWAARRLAYASDFHLKGVAAGAGASDAQGHQKVFVPIGALVNRAKLHGALFVLQFHPHSPRLHNCSKEIEQIVVVEPDAQGCVPVPDIDNFVRISVFAARRDLEPSLFKVKPKRVGALIGKQTNTSDRGG